MTVSELRNRHAGIASRIASAEAAFLAWFTAARDVMAQHNAIEVQDLPEDVREKLADEFAALVSPAQLRDEQRGLEKEIASYEVVLELERLYFLPDTRSKN